MRIALVLVLFITSIYQGSALGRESVSSGRSKKSSSSARSAKGVSARGYNCALENAKKYLKKNAGKKGLKASPITLVDLDAPSDSQRMLIIDPQTGSVIDRHTVSKGRGGVNSRSGSHGSELGFMKVSEPYIGKHGNSVRIDGLESGNRDARGRAIVIHGANYVTEGGNAGRSWGCFAVDKRSVAKVIRKVKGGTLLYSYQSSKVCSQN